MIMKNFGIFFWKNKQFPIILSISGVISQILSQIGAKNYFSPKNGRVPSPPIPMREVRNRGAISRASPRLPRASLILTSFERSRACETISIRKRATKYPRIDTYIAQFPHLRLRIQPFCCQICLGIDDLGNTVLSLAPRRNSWVFVNFKMARYGALDEQIGQCKCRFLGFRGRSFDWWWFQNL